MLTASSQWRLPSLVHVPKLLKVQINPKVFSKKKLFERTSPYKQPSELRGCCYQKSAPVPTALTTDPNLLPMSHTPSLTLRSESPNFSVQGGYLPISLQCSKQQNCPGLLRWFWAFLSSFEQTQTESRAASLSPLRKRSENIQALDDLFKPWCFLTSRAAAVFAAVCNFKPWLCSADWGSWAGGHHPKNSWLSCKLYVNIFKWHICLNYSHALLDC